MLSTSREKDRLRRTMRARRRAFVAGLGAAERGRLERSLADRAGPYLAGARIVAAYAPIGAEIDPAPCLAYACGAIVVLPCFTSGGAGMEFRRAGGAMAPGPHGSLQPQASAAAHLPDVMLVPLVAADPSGTRLGQGGGHFDRALAALRRRGTVQAIGLAWDVQIAETLPTDEWDQRLDLVITPTRIFCPS